MPKAGRREKRKAGLDSDAECESRIAADSAASLVFVSMTECLERVRHALAETAGRGFDWRRLFKSKAWMAASGAAMTIWGCRA
jgi:hypothetical protein